MKKHVLIYFILLTYLGTTFPIQAQNTLKSLPSDSPESVGMSGERLTRVGALMQDYLDKDWIPGAVVIIARQGKIIYHEAYGSNGIKEDSKMEKDDLFRIASMSKPIISVAAMMLYEEGKFLLDEPVSKYIPEFENPVILQEFNPRDSTYSSKPAKKAITIRHLLTHTSGISYGFMDARRIGAIYAKAGIPDLATRENTNISTEIKKLAKLPLLHEPGEGWSYGLNTDVLGYLIEVLSGEKLDEFIKKRILIPLDMNDTGFFYPKNAAKRLVRMAYEGKQGTVDFYREGTQAEMAQFPVEGAKTYFSGGSGLSSTAEDYLKFCQMILNQGKANGKVLLSPKTIELMGKNHIGDKIMWGGSAKFGLGFSISTPESSLKQLGSVGRLGWGGAFNTTFWIDPEEQLIAVLMTQIYPTTHKELYEKFETAVYQAITE